MIERVRIHKRFSIAFSKKTVTLSLLIFFSSLSLYSQTTAISGIVNTYHKAIEIIPAKACIRVADISGLTVNSRVLLIQMKGAAIITTTGSTFGDTISLNNAGNYEIGTVCYIIGDSVFLFHNLLNSYNTATGKVQLVQFGEYYAAEVVDTVKAASWDSAAGTGGVIAIYCDQDLTLNKPIYADSSGYRGGAFLLHNGTCSDFFPANGYVYSPSSTNNFTGAYKGEGVANLTLAQSGGRGAPANGGGGGNNHNNSGAGGANLTAGGNGGGNSSSGVSCTLSFQGLAGKALSSSTGLKLFMGGGGGAGHTNNGLSAAYSYGGNGGGLIFIWANNLIGNGELITAKGGNGGPSASDGAGGGGAGGTIILEVANYSGNTIIRTDGGDGGLSNNGGNNNRCFGGGGGGSGGAIYYSGAIPALTMSATGGAAGIEIGRAGNCNPIPVTALPGNDGQIISNYIFSRSTATAGYCQLLLPVKLVAFNARLINDKVEMDWQIENPADVKRFIIERSINTRDWTEMKAIAGNDQSRQYSTIDANPVPGRSYYRIKFIEKSNAFSYSPVRRITTANKNSFYFYPNPAGNTITIAGNYDCPAELKLTDITGKIIFHTRLSAIPSAINLPVLPSGIYLIRINESVQKLIIR